MTVVISRIRLEVGSVVFVLDSLQRAVIYRYFLFLLPIRLWSDATDLRYGYPRYAVIHSLQPLSEPYIW